MSLRQARRLAGERRFFRRIGARVEDGLGFGLLAFLHQAHYLAFIFVVAIGDLAIGGEALGGELGAMPVASAIERCSSGAVFS